jgi:hypothetical protein
MFEPGSKASKDGLHIRFTDKRAEGYTEGHAVYELWNDNTFISAAYGPGAVLALGLAADYYSKSPDKTNNGLDWLLL